VSQPVQSDFGYHIIKLTDKIVDEETTVESEKEKLIQYYKLNKYEDLLEQLKNDAVIVKN
jgi:parvulin-like peptidyl-prolyl isomerase